MKILISNDGPTAHYYIRLGIAQALQYAGHEVVIWDLKKKSAFSMFDDFEPDLFITQTYNVDRAIYKNIVKRPNMFVIMKGSDYSDFSYKIESKGYPILTAKNKEIELIQSLKEDCGKPNLIFCHYPQEYLDITHKKWSEAGFNVKSLENASNIFQYVKGQDKAEFASDCVFVGGYWPYKGLTLDPYLMPICDSDLKFRIFGNQKWNTHNYCGFLPQEHERHVLKSAKICLNVHEKHSQDFGYDIIERPYKLMSNKCFMISDYVEGLYKKFEHMQYDRDLIFAKTPEKFKELIEYWLDETKEKQELKEFIVYQNFVDTIAKNTYFDRMSDIFLNLGLVKQSKEMMSSKNKLLQEANIL